MCSSILSSHDIYEVTDGKDIGSSQQTVVEPGLPCDKPHSPFVRIDSKIDSLILLSLTD